MTLLGFNFRAAWFFPNGANADAAEERADEPAQHDFHGVHITKVNRQSVFSEVKVPAVELRKVEQLLREEGAVNQMHTAGDAASQQNRFDAGDDLGWFSIAVASPQIAADCHKPADKQGDFHV